MAGHHNQFQSADPFRYLATVYFIKGLLYGTTVINNGKLANGQYTFVINYQFHLNTVYFKKNSGKKPITFTAFCIGVT